MARSDTMQRVFKKQTQQGHIKINDENVTELKKSVVDIQTMIEKAKQNYKRG